MKKPRPISDEEINYSDIPPLTDEQLKNGIRLGRPFIGVGPRKAIQIRLDPIVLLKLKSMAKKKGIGYQTLINDILKRAV